MTTPVTSFNRGNIASMRFEVEAALKAVGAKHGVDFGVGRITFTPSDFRCKITAVPHSAVPNSVAGLVDPKRSAEAVALANVGVYRLGISKADLANQFYHPRLGNATLIGYAPRRHVYPFTVKTARGKTLKIPMTMALDLVKNKIVKAA